MLDAPKQASASDSAKFSIGGTSVDLPVKEGNIGPAVVDISKL